MRIHGLLLLALAAATPAGAQSLLPERTSPGRYELQPIDGGVARLDTLTGEITLCKAEDGSLRCSPAEEKDEPSYSSRQSDDDEPRGYERRRDDREDEDEKSEKAERKDDAEFDKAIEEGEYAPEAYAA